MREIKFRARSKSTNNMALGSWYYFTLGDLIFQGLLDPHDLTDWCQFTGLKDRNGKEIYEGDVLCVFDEYVVPVTDEGQGPTENCSHLVAVEMRNGVWGFDIPKTDDGETGWYGLHYWSENISAKGYEVIGKIYENPDLFHV